MNEQYDDIKAMEICYHPIGLIHSAFTNQEDTPIQGIFNESIGKVEVFSEYTEGLQEIESFSHIILLYHFHRAQGGPLLQKPFLDVEKPRGIFAIRHFNRPNPLGISIVRLLAVEGNMLTIKGVDILDKTPLIDIKPYVFQFDNRDDVSSGWVDDQHLDGIAEWNSTPKALRDRKRINL